MIDRPRLPIVIYRQQIGLFSETFIAAQATMLTRFEPIFAGGRQELPVTAPYQGALIANRGGIAGRAAEYLQVRWGIAPGLLAALRRRKPVAIHAHFGPDGATALLMAGKLGVPLIVTFHGFDATVRDEFAARAHFTHRLYLKRRGRLQRDAMRFIAVSEFIRSELLRQGYPEEKITVHYIGVDVCQFQSDTEVPRENVVLFVGRLVEKKGCEFLISAMARVQDSHPDVELVIVGDGVLRAGLEQQAAASLRRYRFVGVQTPAEVKQWMNRARIFSVPSVTAASGDAEALGIVFLEAQAMGLPVATFASGGIGEAVLHGTTGLLAAERDVDGLAANIQTLLDDEELWERMSRSGPERVREHFDLRTQTGKLEEMYESLR